MRGNLSSGAQSVDDRAHAVVPSRAPAGTDAQGAEREVEVVVDDEDPVGLHARLVRERKDDVPGAVHPGLGLHEERARVERTRPAEVPRAGVAFEAACGGKEQAFVRREPIEHAEPDVVPCSLVLGPGVAESEDQPPYGFHHRRARAEGVPGAGRRAPGSEGRTS
jgi:hypothetical protein